MLQQCAPGYEKEAKTHNWHVKYSGKTYPTLPLGPHGRRQNPDIEIGHVRSMIRFFGIEDCAKKHLKQLH